MNVWLVLTDENRLFEFETSLTEARRAAKAIGGYIMGLTVEEDYRPGLAEAWGQR